MNWWCFHVVLFHFQYNSALCFRFPISYIWILLLVLDFHTRKIKLIIELATYRLPLIRTRFSSRWKSDLIWKPHLLLECTVVFSIFRLLVCWPLIFVQPVVWVVPGVPLQSIFHCWRVLCWSVCANFSSWSGERYSFWCWNLHVLKSKLSGYQNFHRNWCWYKANSEFQGECLWCGFWSIFKLVPSIWIHQVQGYMVGNGVADEHFDGNALVPFAHGMGLISDDLFEVGGVFEMWYTF